MYCTSLLALLDEIDNHLEMSSTLSVSINPRSDRKKHKIIDSGSVHEHDQDGGSYGFAYLFGSHSFDPLYLIREWKDPDS